MTAIVDTSVWIRLFKDKAGLVKAAIEANAGTDQVVMLPPIRLDLLQGCRGEPEWRSMLMRLSAFDLLPVPETTWDGAARIYFELRQAGLTVRSALDCCIAQLAIDNKALLVHCDRDFEAIAGVRPLKHVRLQLDTV
jgi:predicted nucleic acid-binding protein